MKLKKLLCVLAALTIPAGCLSSCSLKKKSSDSSSETEDDESVNVVYRDRADLDGQPYITKASYNEQTDKLYKEYKAKNDSIQAEDWSGVPVHDKKALTLMVYMVGSNLESGGGMASMDIAEMCESNFVNEDVNLVVYCGGAYQWYVNIPQGSNSYLEYLPGQKDFAVYEDKERNMGDASTFADFMNDVYEKYPADEFGLICWDHGGGPVFGYGQDEKYDDILSMSEMKSALDSTPFKEDKLSFIGFDACLMASLEIADTMQDYSDRLVASCNTEPGFGWDYSFLSVLDQTLDPDTLCDTIVKSYDSFYYNNRRELQKMMGGRFHYSLASFDLTKTDAVVEDLNALFGAACDDYAAGKLYPISMLKKTVQYDGYDLWDVGDYAKRMKKYYPDQSKALTKDLKSFINLGYSSIRRSNCTSFYFPSGSNSTSDYIYSSCGGDQYINDFPICENYAKFVDMFKNGSVKASFGDMNISSEDGSKEAAANSEGDIAIEGDWGVYKLSEEQAADFAGAYYTVFREFDPGDFGTAVEGFKLTPSSGKNRDFEVLVENIPIAPEEDGSLRIDLDPDVVIADTDEPMEYANVCRAQVVGVTDDETVYRTVNGVLETGQYQNNCVRNNDRVYADITFTSDNSTGETVIDAVDADSSEGFHLSGKSLVNPDEWNEYLNYVEYVKIPKGEAKNYTDCGTLSLMWRTIPFNENFGFKTVKASELPEYTFAVQLCIVDRNGNVHATPMTSIPKEKNFKEATVKSDAGEYAFRVYSDYAKLVSYSGKDAEINVPAEVEGVPVTEIGNAAFDLTDASKLVKMTFPDSVETMGAIFRSRLDRPANLKEVKLPASLKTIPSNAFENCESLSDVSLPEGLEFIGDRAFAYTAVKSIEIPASVTHIGVTPFAGCASLKNFSVNEGNQTYSSKDGALYSKDMTVLVAYCGVAPKTFKVPEGVKEIADYAFYGSSSLVEELEYPDDYDLLGYFAEWLDADTDEWNRRKKLEEYGVKVNYNYSGLEKLSLPEGLVRIGDYAFTDCVQLSEIALPDSLEYVGVSAFGIGSGTDSHYYKAGEFKKLSEIKIGSSLKRIRVGAFSGYDVSKFTVDSANPYFSVKSGKLMSAGGSSEIPWADQDQSFLE